MLASWKSFSKFIALSGKEVDGVIVYRKGNLFESDADCLVNTVNCEGYMGKGIAYQFKLRFPENNEKYAECCHVGKLRPGILFTFKEKGKTIINFPTKDQWRKPSELRYVIDGLDEFLRILPDLGINKIAMPPLGCGNGGLNWPEVKRVIEEKLGDSRYDIEIYEPSVNKSFDPAREQMTVYDLLLLHVREGLENASSLRFQKTFYFANYFGKKQLFSFARGKQGPYSKELYRMAENLGRYQKANGLNNARDTYKAIYQLICSRKVDEQYKKLEKSVDEALRIVNGTKDDLLLEGTATALYLILNEKVTRQSDLISAFKEWSDDKAARFSEAEVLRSIEKLEDLGILQRDIFGTLEVV
jgi:O-acetyl-ADP-ribose deacetylase (regulator of RNase III)